MINQSGAPLTTNTLSPPVRQSGRQAGRQAGKQSKHIVSNNHKSPIFLFLFSRLVISDPDVASAQNVVGRNHVLGALGLDGVDGVGGEGLVHVALRVVLFRQRVHIVTNLLLRRLRVAVLAGVFAGESEEWGAEGGEAGSDDYDVGFDPGWIEPLVVYVRMRLQLDIWRGLTYEVQIKTSIVES